MSIPYVTISGYEKVSKDNPCRIGDIIVTQNGLDVGRVYAVDHHGFPTDVRPISYPGRNDESRFGAVESLTWYKIGLSVDETTFRDTRLREWYDFCKNIQCQIKNYIKKRNRVKPRKRYQFCPYCGNKLPK